MKSNFSLTHSSTWRVFSTDKDYHLTLKMASARVVETADTNNSPSQDSSHPDDLFQSKYFTCPVIALAWHTLCFESTFKKFPKGIHRNQD